MTTVPRCLDCGHVDCVCPLINQIARLQTENRQLKLDIAAVKMALDAIVREIRESMK